MRTVKKDDWKRMFLQAVPLFFALALAIAFYFLLLRYAGLQRRIQKGIEILMPFIYGGVMAYLLKTPCNFFDRILERHLPRRMKKHKTGASVLIVLVIAFAVLYTLLRTVVPEVANSINMLTRMVPGRIQYFFDWLSEYLKNDGVVQSYIRPIVEDLSNQAVDWTNGSVLPYLEGMMGGVTETLTSIFNIVYNLGIGLIVCIYALCARKKFSRQGKAVIYSIFKPHIADRIMKEIIFIDETFDGFLGGKILDSTIVGLICYGFCLIMTFTRGFNNSILVSLIIGVTNIIPYFGPFIGAVPATLLVMINDPINAVIFVLFIIVLQQFDGNILGPRLLAGSVGLSGFWVLFSITFFGGVFGFAGVLIGVPVFAVIYDLIRKLVKKGLIRNGKLELMPREETPEKEERAV